VSDTIEEYLPNPEVESSAIPKRDATPDATPLRPGEFYPPLGDESATSTPNAKLVELTANGKPPVRAPVLRVLSLSEIKGYEPPAGSFLVGDGVIELGECALLYGPPGSFKGFAIGQLMACGAWGHGEWLGHPVKSKFASLWLNCENGRRRLRDQFSKVRLPEDADHYIHVTDIPEVWNLADVRLSGEIRRTIVEKQIRLLIVDTVSNFTEDEFAKQFAAFFSALNTMLHGIELRPAVLLIHHSRKPKETDKGARGLLNLISGHQTLQRRARSICYLGRVSDGFEERRLAAVWLKVSNNGEAEGSKTALQLTGELTLQPIPDFDWSQWHGASSSGTSHREPKVKEEHVRQVFELGLAPLPLNQAVERLQEIAGVSRSTAYEALKTGEGARFDKLLVCQPGYMISLRTAGA
jgi:hypothetical protein